ncbi:alkaline phosphatase family protein [Chryseosolibacter indicus]|uniref:Alkaline phosphatase family protein n=1 Tax=Chryseosolibacter indicus TaxID=2782351 RepID=A0ABS5VUR4_9BACT|nr:alkaline phosphatase family protein [Chryseosolibacter indicus]MBT1704783.1 alkaline phosphatase family protein [Chryseosolibacter indicus]
MKLWCTIFLLLLVCISSLAQELNTRNVIIITLDGYRWQELFYGADDKILYAEKYVSDTSVISSFGRGEEAERREDLMPFFWNVIAKQGQLYGNRKFGNKVNCSNHHLLSYPGYSEMFVGFADKRVSSNKEIVNPNPTVFEFISQHKDEYNKRIAAFATWGTFPYILREAQAQFHINAGDDIAKGSISTVEKEINELKKGKKREDKHTFYYALEYLKRERPRIVFIGFDETDAYAHEGRYDEYLKAAHRADEMIRTLWDYLQSDPYYRDKTTLLITTDHGRGKGKNIWKNHRLLARGSRHIWFAALGPDTPSFGEMKFASKYYQKQLASTIASFIGLRYKPVKQAGEVVQTMIAVPDHIPTNDKSSIKASLK